MTSRQRWIRLLVRLYPAAWRREFGGEFADVLERTALDVPALVNVVMGAAGEWAVHVMRRIAGGCGMETSLFEARYDGMARAFSVVLVVVLLAIPLLMARSGVAAILVGACSLTVLGLSYAYSPRGYAITGGALRIQRLAGDVVFPLDRLRFLRDATPSDFWGSIRLWGSSGLFGYYGRYWSSRTGTSRWYVTDRSRALLVSDGDGVIVVSPEDRNGFVEALGKNEGSEEPGRVATGPGDWRQLLTLRSLLGIGIGAAALGLVVAALRYDPGRPPVELQPDSLAIHSRFYGMTIEAASVDVGNVRVVDMMAEKNWRPTLRVGGFANSHYSAGNFRVRNGRTVKLFTTGSRKLVLLPPREETGTPVLLDVEEPEQFAARVRQMWNRP